MKNEIPDDVVEAVVMKIRVELNQWNLDMRDGKGSPHAWATHWMPMPTAPNTTQIEGA